MYGKIRNIHFVGIGGAGMSGIAEVLINLGYSVSGSDLKETSVTRRLESLGARIVYRHEKKNVGNSDVIVISSAIKDNNPEVEAARERGIPVIKRAEMLAELMRLKYGIAVSGSHGKTTTTSMIECILTEGGLDPTAIVGGKLISSGTGAKLGTGEFLVAEADESDGSFHNLNPAIVVITNVDEEHLDFYGDFQKVKEAFVRFGMKVPFYGLVVACIDDRGVMEIIPYIHKRLVTYGISPQADLKAINVRQLENGTGFNVLFKDKEVGNFFIPMKGQHNLLNSLAAISVGIELDVPVEKITKGLAGFKGVHRRFEIKGEREGITVIDDYGHHPTEIEKTIETAREYFGDRRIVVIFQPHRYSRTRLLLKRFPSALKLADIVILCEVYPAGESPAEGGTGTDLFNEIQRQGLKNVYFCPALEEAQEKFNEIKREKDVLITLGAGDVYTIAERFVHGS